MPDESDGIPLTRVSGTWGPLRPEGPGVAHVHAGAMRVLNRSAGEIVIVYGTLSGGSWRTGRLALHGASGALVLEAERGLERAWVTLVAEACPIPEFTRGLRTLGSRRSGGHEGHLRYFAPLLYARRRLEDERELEQRLAAFDAAFLRERLEQILASLAQDAHPLQAPERRALEAELLDANEPVFAALNSLRDAASQFRQASDERRFDRWRAWVSAVAAVFADADRSWEAMAGLLPALRVPTGPSR
ncbi:MAG TPA: hypothetical protein VLE53_01855 [Gemmatimonadaceae bacterium]|nr:hypothetical protein [Gemmatimonadaceae bacterium]